MENLGKYFQICLIKKSLVTLAFSISVALNKNNHYNFQKLLSHHTLFTISIRFFNFTKVSCLQNEGYKTARFTVLLCCLFLRRESCHCKWCKRLNPPTSQKPTHPERWQRTSSYTRSQKQACFLPCYTPHAWQPLTFPLGPGLDSPSANRKAHACSTALTCDHPSSQNVSCRHQHCFWRNWVC